MDFSWDSEQRAHRQRIIEFAQKRLNQNLNERDQTGSFDRALWLACAEQGLQGAYIPQLYGGCGYSVVTTIAMLEALGYGCRDNGLTLAINGQMWSVQEPILNFGSEAQKLKYLPKLCDGSWLAAHGMTEPDSGSNAYGLSTTATKAEGGYILNGHKWLVGLAPVCDLALVFAVTDPSLKQWGISAFLVEAGMAGFTRSQPTKKMGLRTSPLGELTLENCFVPEENRLGPEGAGVAIFNGSMEWERSFIFASHVGSMARQLDDCIAYTNEREVYGNPIGDYQSVSNRLADMKLRLETAQLLLYKAAWQKDQGESISMLAALAKLHLGEAFVASSTDAIRIFGGKGYLSDFGVERDLRDAMGGVIYSGTSDIQRNIIARLLRLDG